MDKCFDNIAFTQQYSSRDQNTQILQIQKIFDNSEYCRNGGFPDRADKGAAGSQPTKEQPGAGASRQGGRTAGSKGGHYPRVFLGSTIQWWPLSKGGSWVHYPRVHPISIYDPTPNDFNTPTLGISSKPILKLFAPTIAMPCKTTYSNTFMQCCTCKETKYGQYHNLGH